MVDCLVMNFLSCRDGKLWNVSPSVYNKNESVLRSISLWLCKRAYRVLVGMVPVNESPRPGSASTAES
jgi:hypothetical protein